MFGAAKLSLFLAAPDIGYGYWMGGYTTGRISTTRKYNFFNDVVGAGTALGASLDQCCGLSDTINGHSFGGSNGNSVTTHYIFNCASEARTTGTALPTARRDNHAGTSTSDYGYIFGGYNTNYVNTIQKYQHSNDTYPTFTTTLWTGTVWTSTVAHNNTALACVVGGYNGSAVCNRYKVFTFSTEAVSADLTLSPEQGQLSVCGSQAVGYYCSGFTTAGTMVTTVQKFTFASETWATGTALSYSARYGDGCSSPSNGVIGGAYVGSFSIATAQTKIAYATDTYSTASQIYTTNTDTPGAWSSSQIQ
jgi:hypothetical protein